MSGTGMVSALAVFLKAPWYSLFANFDHNDLWLPMLQFSSSRVDVAFSCDCLGFESVPEIACIHQMTCNV